MNRNVEPTKTSAASFGTNVSGLMLSLARLGKERDIFDPLNVHKFIDRIYTNFAEVLSLVLGSNPRMSHSF